MYYLWVTSKKLILISALVWRLVAAKNYQLFLISPFYLAHRHLSPLGQSQASIGSRDHVTANQRRVLSRQCPGAGPSVTLPLTPTITLITGTSRVISKLTRESAPPLTKDVKIVMSE